MKVERHSEDTTSNLIKAFPSRHASMLSPNQPNQGWPLAGKNILSARKNTYIFFFQLFKFVIFHVIIFGKVLPLMLFHHNNFFDKFMINLGI